MTWQVSTLRNLMVEMVEEWDINLKRKSCQLI
jgi:hypothetical protein